MNFRFFPTMLVICGIAALAWFTGGFFNSTNVCSDCGALQSVHRVVWIPFKTFRETPLSLYLKSSGLTRSPSHDWLLVAGSGGPIRCALGSGRELTFATRNSDLVGSLKLIRNHRGDTEAKQWIDRLLNVKQSRDAFLTIAYLADDPEDFESGYVLSVEWFAELQAKASP